MFFNAFILTIVVLLIMAMFFQLIQKYKSRGKKIALYLAADNFTILIPTIVILLQQFGIEIQNVHYIGIPILSVGVGNLFLIMIMREVFNKPSKFVQKYINIVSLVFIGILGVFTIYGMLVSPQEKIKLILDISYLSMLVFSLNSMYLYAYLFKESLIMRKRVESDVGKRGFTYIFIFAISAALFMPLNIMITLPVPNKTFVFGLVWCLAIVSTVSAYFGFISPEDSLKPVLPYLYIIPTVAAAFMSVITFVQIGLPLLGTEVLGIPELTVSAIIIGFAFAGAAGALLGGKILDFIKDSLKKKLLLSLLISILSLGIMKLIPNLASSTDYLLWMLLLGFVSGVGSVNLYSLLFDLIPTGYRGRIGGIIVAMIYGIGPFIVPSNRTFEAYTASHPAKTALQLIGLGAMIIILIFKIVPKETIKINHGDKPRYDYKFKEVLVLLTIILFIDSFGFIRAINEPEFVKQTWEGGMGIRTFISIVHIISALVCGYLYDKKSPYFIVKISLIAFFIGNMFFAFMYQTSMESALVYLFPLVYAPAVSIYTLLFLMIWADITTEETEGKIYGLGLAVAAWLASFISTGLVSIIATFMSPQVHVGLTGIGALVAFILFNYKKNEIPNKKELTTQE